MIVMPVGTKMERKKVPFAQPLRAKPVTWASGLAMTTKNARAREAVVSKAFLPPAASSSAGNERRGFSAVLA